MATDVGCGSKYAYDNIETENDYDPPYRVLFPGQHRVSSSSSFSKDPRLGSAQILKEEFIKHHKRWGKYPFDFDADDDDDDDEDELDDDDEWEQVPLTEEEMRPGPCKTIQSLEGSYIFRGSKFSGMEREKKYYQQWKNKIKSLEKFEANILKNRDCKCAEAAIEFYNKKHGTDYEIVETLGSYKGIYLGFWFHCNFRAQRKSDTGHGRRPKLFFAELCIEEYEMVVKHCQILLHHRHCSHIVSGRAPLPKLFAASHGKIAAKNLGKTYRHRHCSRIVRGCRMCPNQLWHPINKCTVGFKKWTVGFK